ncbi:MAG TPA: DUF134 domain-containing protein [Methanomicrobia archaeon]|nr:DUF134 domain-containing protein [Methanomicrobia archaeon]
MPGRRRCRCVGFQPQYRYFEPQVGPRGGKLRARDTVTETVLKLDELESIRLKDQLGLSQEEAAKQMGVSQPTFHRIVSEAHRKIADALVEGKAIRIEGGHYVLTKAEGHVPAPALPPGWRAGRHGQKGLR